MRELRFLNGPRPDGVVKIKSDGAVDGQTLRSVRELTKQSQAAFESLLASKDAKPWTEEELRAAVSAYLEMAARQRAGHPVVKKQYYEDLGSRFGRAAGAFEYRMQNISFVLTLLGREWIPGLPPAKNVGTRIAGELERLIAETEGTVPLGNAADAVIVAKARGTDRPPPVGTKKPTRTTRTVTSIARDLEVKAWVLDRAKGTCEACSEPAPFVSTDDFPFLEVHHIRHLADGGSDTTSNAVALCPNCHRRLHHSRDARDYRETLFVKVSALVRE